MKVLILRGLPGSGKTTFVSGLKGVKAICSADDYHIVNGEYRFDPKNIGNAHNDCLRKFLRVAQNDSGYPGPEFLIVDNTNTLAWEISPYYRVAECLNLEVKIVYLHCPFEVACSRNLHQVPYGTIWRMAQNLMHEQLPPHWKQDILFPEQIDTNVLLQASEKLMRTIREM